MQEDTKPKDEKVSDAQPIDENIPDPQPKNEDIPDKKGKEPLTRSEYHGLITSYAGLVLSLIAIILSVITMYQSHMMETREIVQILRAEDDGYYHFDGETLFKNYQVTVANNSAIPVSVVEITIERDGEARTFEVSDLPDILPLNMEANYTEVIKIPWNIDTSAEDAQKIQDEFSSEILKESDIVTSSKVQGLEDSWVWIPESWILESADDWEELIINESADDLIEVIIPPGVTMINESAFANTSNLQFISIPSSTSILLQNTLDLTVTLCTAKNNHYILTTMDTGALIFETNESTWVANRIAKKSANQAALSQLFGTQNTD